MPDTPLYVAVGFLVGTLVGLTGVGGGSMMTPILMLLFGQSPTVAVGTDLLFAATTKLVATASFGFSRRVDWPVVGRLMLGSVPGAAAVMFGLWLTRRVPSAADTFTSRSLAIILALTALGLILQTPLQRLGLKVTARALVQVERHKIMLTALAGLVLGVAVTLTSVGAGALGVVMLLALYPLRLSSDRLIATDIAHALPITLIAGLGHALLGHVNFNVLAALLLGSIPGVLIASRITLRLPARITRTLIALMLGTVSERMLFG
ncbi:MAG TPA: sulfite exporter TauE/SafE family protein [Steroidobacteraceae bacterium]|nr:sulfite exporter TauE/SafE family protein [Steroidobacteraceae bacterium]